MKRLTFLLLWTFGVLTAWAQPGVQPVPPTTPFTRWLMGATNQGDFAARLGITVIPPGTTTNTFYGSFRGLDFGVTNQNGQTISQQISSQIVAGVPPWNGTNYVFLCAPPGGQTNANGLTRNTAVADALTACNIATNLIAHGITNVVIDLLPGVLDCSGSGVRLPDNVSWISEPASTLLWTNGNINTITFAGFCVGNNSQVWNLNMFNPDQGNSAVCIGEGSSDSGNPATQGKTNWAFYNLSLVTYSTGLHWEGPLDPAYKSGTFVNPYILANRSCMVVEMPNLHITLINPNFTSANFVSNKIANSKPMCVIEFNHQANASNGPAVTVQGGIFHYADTDISGTNRPNYALWSGNNFDGIGLQGTNQGISLSGTTFDPYVQTNGNSFDIFGSTNSTYLLANVMRSDGNAPTVTNLPGVDCLVHGLNTQPTGTPTSGSVAVVTSTGTRAWTTALNLATSTNLPSSSVIGGNGITPAPTGTVGEVITNVIGLPTATNLTSGSVGYVTNVLLTPGVWLITGSAVFVESSATVFNRVAALSPNPGLSAGAGGASIYNDAFNDAMTTTTSETNTIVPPIQIFNATIPTTFYLNVRAVFTAGTVSACGSISAVRIY